MEDSQLQLTLALPSYNGEQPQASAAESTQSNNHEYDQVAPTVRPFIFRPLSTNAPVVHSPNHCPQELPATPYNHPLALPVAMFNPFVPSTPSPHNHQTPLLEMTPEQLFMMVYAHPPLPPPMPPCDNHTKPPSPSPTPPPTQNNSPAPPPEEAAVLSGQPSSAVNPPRRQKQKKTGREGSSSADSPGESETIEPPYPWATDKRCHVYTVQDLRSKGHLTIIGTVKCRRCERVYQMSYELQENFLEVATYILRNKGELYHRAPDFWLNPVYPDCVYCHQKNAVRPEMDRRRSKFNWLFLFLGKMLGICTGDDLKYFCKHHGNHRTASKDRLLYITYLTMCRQLDPTGPFDIDV